MGAETMNVDMPKLQGNILDLVGLEAAGLGSVRLRTCKDRESK